MCKRLEKKPCRFCGKWFWPDPRVGSRQRACSAEECRRKRRAATQAEWRRKNPDYAIAYRMEKCGALPERERPERRYTPPLDRLPWDLAKDQFEAQGCEFIAELGRVLLAGAKDQRRSQVARNAKETAAHPPPGGKDQTATVAG
jgi:hypothetical protein